MRKLFLYVLFVVVIVAIGYSRATTAAPELATGASIVKLDPALDAIIDPNAKIEQLAVREHFGVTEGTIWVNAKPNGYLLFSDISANVIYKWTPDDKVTVFLENSGYTGKDITEVGGVSISGRTYVTQVGSNGLTLDPQGNVIICAEADRNLVRLEKNGKRTVLADRWQGKRISGPNDVIVKSDGAIYFTDGTTGLRGKQNSPLKELSFSGLFLVKDGNVTLLDPTRWTTPGGGGANGLAFSPDEKYLWASAGPKIVRYDVKADDTIANPQVLGDFAKRGSDGLRVDSKGNVYTSSGGTRKEGEEGNGVWILSPEGKHLGTIDVPKIAGWGTTNVAFGDADDKTLYIAARTQLFRVRVKVPGVHIGPKS